MKQLLTKNLGLKIASLLLACVLWFVIAQIGNPRDTKSFGNIPVVLRNTELLDAENKVYEVVDNTDVVRVTISAPMSILSNLRTSDIIAEADVSKLTDINTIAIRYSVLNADVDSNSITGDHDVVRLNVEEKETKWISVIHETVGQVAEGYVNFSETPDQTQIEVSGPKSVISQIEYAKIQLDVSDASAHMSANVPVELYDKSNQLMDQTNIRKNTDTIHMFVEVFPTKEIGVHIKTSGTPPDGYALTGKVESSINSLLVAGGKYQLMSLSNVTVPSELLDVTGKTETFTVAVDLAKYLPASVQAANSGTNTVANITVEIEPIREKTLIVPIRNLVIVGQVEGKDIALGLDSSEFSFQVSGLARDLEPLRGDTVKAVVDVGEWMKQKGVTTLNDGDYDVPITLQTQDAVTVLNRQSVKIKISKEQKEE